MAITWWGEKVWEDMADSVKAGMTSFKHFMAYKGALMVNDDEMYQSFKRVGDLGGLAMVHAENGDVVAELTAKLIAEGNTGPEGHAYSRPPQVEGEATNRAIMIADMAGVPLYVVHTSCEQAHEAIRRARQKGMRVYGEPLIQHLVLDETEYFNKDWNHSARRVMSRRSRPIIFSCRKPSSASRYRCSAPNPASRASARMAMKCREISSVPRAACCCSGAAAPRRARGSL